MWAALALVAVAAAAKEPAKYWDETAHRTVDHSHRDSEHEHYAQQRSRVERAVGAYRFYVYGGGAFDAMTTDLLRGREHKVDDLYVLAEDKVELWTHRALLNDSRRTDDPADADVFFVPAYLTLSTLLAGPAEQRDTNVHQHEISVFFAANGRPQATKWSGCNRSTALGLKALPKAAIHVSRARAGGGSRGASSTACGASDRLFGRRLADAHKVLVESSSRDARACEPPCRPGWGWFVSGEKHPHTPFHDTLIDYSRFPRVDEKWFYEDALAATKAAIANVTSAAELEIWKYLDAIRGDVVYGYGGDVDGPARRRTPTASSCASATAAPSRRGSGRAEGPRAL
ncbi:hypothetical protein JL720_1451 [Aureococcus anophagefferens]|nr:hypothetical protein JL720_1451 [Aureococcus anophagefferens]